jgi:hypothetical protein
MQFAHAQRENRTAWSQSNQPRPAMGMIGEGPVTAGRFARPLKITFSICSLISCAYKSVAPHPKSPLNVTEMSPVIYFHFDMQATTLSIGRYPFSLLTAIHSMYETSQASKCGQTTCANFQVKPIATALRSDKKHLLEASQ